MKNLKVIFMGSPLFSVPVLEALHKNVNIVAVVTSPDAPVGRKKILTMSPVKEAATNLGLPTYSPSNIKKDYQFIKDLNPDMIITCAYGQILNEEILNIPKLGCINLHGSLLPKYRGAAPIHYALINGEKETGITLMYMDKGTDTGDIISKEIIPISEDDNIETLTNKLSILASKMIIDNLPSLIYHTNKREKQNEQLATFTKIITREDEHINFNNEAIKIYNHIRALTPNPLPNFKLEDIEYKIAECEITNAQGKPSAIVEVNKNYIVIMCKDKGIKITKIKPTGKNIMTVKDFLNGYHKELLNKEVY